MSSDQKTKDAWTERGFEAGWIGGQKKAGLPAWLTYVSDRERKLVTDPFLTFDLRSSVDFQKRGGLKDLPIVTVPFGVRLVPTTVGDDITDAVVKELAGQPNLIWLEVDGSFTKVTDEVVQYLVGLNHLNCLTLPRAALTDRSLDLLASAGRLHALKQAETHDVQRPSNNQEVFRFEMGIESGQELTDEGVKHLAVFTNLKRLTLRMVIDYKRALTEVRPGQLPRLPRESKRLSDACLKHLEGLTQLEELDLSDMAITDIGAKELAKHAALTRLVLDRTEITDAALKDLANLTRLSTLSIRGTDVSPAAVQEFLASRPDCMIEK